MFCASASVISPSTADSWSNNEIASRRLPVAWRATNCIASGCTWKSSPAATCLQLCHDLTHRDTAEFMTLTAGKHRSRDLMHFGGCQHKDGMRRWFFQCFQQRIKSRRREHVHFVDDVDFETPLVGEKLILSRKSRMSSTLVLEAASISIRSRKAPLFTLWQ